MSTDRDVAIWLNEKIIKEHSITQEEAVSIIKDEFGDEYVYEGDAGNLCIKRSVTNEFRKLKSERVEWDRTDKSWSYN